MNSRRRGQVQVLMSAVFFSTAGLFTGVIDAGIWTIIFWRSLFALLFAIALMAAMPRRATSLDMSGVAAAVLSAGAMLSFISALRLTSVANVAVIHGSLPLLTALLGWLTVRARVRPADVLLCVMAGLGATLIFSGSVSSGLRLAGDALALLMTFLMAMMTIAFRYSASSSLLLVALSNGLAVLAGAWGAPALSISISIGTAGLLACFALVQMTLGLLCYAAGSRLLLPAETALITLFEVPLSALWVWLAFDEVPLPLTVAGAAIILTSVLVHLVTPINRQGDRPGALRDAD